MTYLFGPLIALTIVLPAQSQGATQRTSGPGVTSREVDFPGIDDPKMTLRDALILLRRRYGLNIWRMAFSRTSRYC